MRATLPTVTQIWREPPEIVLPVELTSALSLPDLVVRMLYRQGVRTAAEARAFMDFRSYSPTSPFDLPDLAKGIERISQAVKSGEKIGVWGDFDVDGQTSTALLVSALREIGADVLFHIPVRGKESHGIQLKALKEFVKQGISVIVTCDTGISEVESVAWAQSHGIDVIITDHHSLPSTLPNAYALINPQFLDGSHPLRPLPGVGVASKFAEALLDSYGKTEVARSLHDLVALGTIADIAELRADGRYLTQSGIDLIRNRTRPSIKAMLEAAEISPDQFNEEGISFLLAPRMNAVGRLADANPMVEFLLSENPAVLSVTVNQLEGLNAHRKMLCDDVFKGALTQIERTPSLLDHPVLVLQHPEWDAGVVGIVASRLVSLYHRPVIILVSPPGQLMRGSARSVDGINITAAIREQAALLSSFGGHPMAAGLSLDERNFKPFQRGLDSSVEQQLLTNPLKSELQIDAWQQPSALDLSILQSLDRLAPFGAGNPPPVYAAKDMRLLGATPVGKTREHLQVIVEDTLGQQSKFIWWQGAGLPQPEGTFDLAYTARNSTYKGKPQVQLEWLDFRSVIVMVEITAKKRNKLENFDYRSNINPRILLVEAIKEFQPEIYREGSDDYPLKGKTRAELDENESLIIWSIPPSQIVLDEIINQVHPARIVWFGQNPPENDLDVFLKSAAKVLKENLTQTDPTINLAQTASSLATTSELTALVINWFAARGDIKIVNQDKRTLRYTSGGTPDKLLENEFRVRVKKTFEEIQAYRRFYLKTDLNNLLDRV